jgi:hypothetical protein
LVKATDFQKRFSIVGFGHPIRTEVLGDLDDETLYSGMHLVDSAEVRHTAGDALVALLAESSPPMSWLGAAALRSPALRRHIGSTYEAIARHRGSLARFVPDVAPVTVTR